jgi:hypothetical protein
MILTEEMRQRPGKSISRSWVAFTFKAPVALVGLLGGVYAISLIVRFREDTTPITNTGFAIMATLAALSFSFARVIENEGLRDRVAFAGERLLHGALLVLVASILKYFIFLLYRIPTFAGSIIEHVTTFAFASVGAGIFALGVTFSHTGLRILNDLLVLRIARHKDWDNLW